MRFLKIFASVVLVCFSFALKGRGQQVELKLDSTYQANFFESDEKFIGRNYTIYMGNEPYLKLNEVVRDYYIEEIKQTISFSEYYLNDLKGETIAAIDLHHKPNSTISQAIVNAPPVKLEIRFYTNYQERFIYNNPKLKPVDSVLINFINDLIAFDVLKGNEVIRPGLKKLFLHYNQDVTDKANHVPGPTCGTGIFDPYRYIDFTNNQLEIGGDKKLNCSFSINKMRSDEIIQSINFYNNQNKFIGTAQFQSDEGDYYGAHILTYKFIPNNEQEKTFIILDYKGYADHDDPLIKDDYRIIYKFDYYINTEFIGTNLHPKIIGQIFKISEEIRRLYYF